MFWGCRAALAVARMVFCCVPLTLTCRHRYFRAGGTIVEPLMDVLAVLGGMVDARGMVLVPGFYRGVRPLTAEEVR